MNISSSGSPPESGVTEVDELGAKARELLYDESLWPNMHMARKAAAAVEELDLLVARLSVAEQARDSYAESLRLTSDALQAEEDKADAAMARAEAAETERDRLGDASYDWEMAYIAAVARAEAAETMNVTLAETVRIHFDRAEAAEQALREIAEFKVVTETFATYEIRSPQMEEEGMRKLARAALAGREETGGG